MLFDLFFLFELLDFHLEVVLELVLGLLFLRGLAVLGARLAVLGLLKLDGEVGLELDEEALDLVDQHGARRHEQQLHVRALAEEVRRHLEVRVLGLRVLLLELAVQVVELVVGLRREQPQRARGGLAGARPAQTQQVVRGADHELLLRGESELQIGNALDQLEQLEAALLVGHALDDAAVGGLELVALEHELELLVVEELLQFEQAHVLVAELGGHDHVLELGGQVGGHPARPRLQLEDACEAEGVLGSLLHGHALEDQVRVEAEERVGVVLVLGLELVDELFVRGRPHQPAVLGQGAAIGLVLVIGAGGDGRGVGVVHELQVLVVGEAAHVCFVGLFPDEGDAARLDHEHAELAGGHQAIESDQARLMVTLDAGARPLLIIVD